MDANERAHQEIEHRLAAGRAVPAAGFRARLRRQLLTGRHGGAAAPRTLRLLIGTYASSGIGLLLVVALGVAGAGPFAP